MVVRPRPQVFPYRARWRSKTKLWEAKEQQEAQGTRIAGSHVFISCQDVNESDTRTGHVYLSSCNSMLYTTRLFSPLPAFIHYSQLCHFL